MSSAFEKHRDTLEHHETMMGTSRGRLAVAMDLLTDSLARLAYHAFYGKVDPERIDKTWNLAQVWHGPDSVTRALGMLNAKSLYGAIEALKPKAPMYDRFRQALAKYRAYEAAGGWKPIAAGPALKLGKGRLTPAFLAELQKFLRSHELVKLRFLGTERDERAALCARIADEGRCVCVGAVGHTALFYRQHPEPAERTIALPVAPSAQP